MKGTHASSWAVLYIMFFFSSVYFECVKGPSSSDPEEHQLRSGLWPVLAFWTAAFWTASSESESESWVFWGALVWVGFLAFVFLRRCGGPGFVRLPIR